MTPITTNICEPVSIRSRIAAHTKALTADDLASILNVSKLSIYKLAKKGILPSFRIGTSVRFDPRKIADWLVKQ